MSAGRLIAGGLLAGLVLNIGEAVLHGVLVADQAAAAMNALGKDVTGTPLALGSLVAVTFVQGLIGMWLYSVSKQSAIAIGLAMWFLSGVYSATYFWAGFPRLLPDNVLWWPVACELVLYPLATLAGAAILGKK